jgi:hypothetical protein
MTFFAGLFCAVSWLILRHLDVLLVSYYMLRDLFVGLIFA